VAASSHREAPLIASDPRADNTDVYAFVSPDRQDSATLIGDWIPFEAPYGGPNYFKFADEVNYAMHLDTLGDTDWNDYQTYTVNEIVSTTSALTTTVLASNLSSPLVNIGSKSTPNYRASGPRR
jgi:Domain of unknown function (DUF4331)